jgi:hypothetical protein
VRDLCWSQVISRALVANATKIYKSGGPAGVVPIEQGTKRPDHEDMRLIQDRPLAPGDGCWLDGGYDQGPSTHRSVRDGSNEVCVGLDEHIALLDGPDGLRVVTTEVRRVARTGPVEV